MRVLARVRQAPIHFVEVTLFPVYFEPRAYRRQRRIEINQKVGPREACNNQLE